MYVPRESRKNNKAKKNGGSPVECTNNTVRNFGNFLDEKHHLAADKFAWDSIVIRI